MQSCIMGVLPHACAKVWQQHYLMPLHHCRHEAARHMDDAAHRVAGQANKGIDKTYGTRRDYHTEADSARDVQEKGKDALGSAKDAAVQTK